MTTDDQELEEELDVAGYDPDDPGGWTRTTILSRPERDEDYEP